jgi:hypothetical protein
VFTNRKARIFGLNERKKQEDRENYVKRSFIICHLRQTKENELNEAYSTHVTYDKSVQSFALKSGGVETNWNI